MINEPFVSGESTIHRMDPRVKIIFSTVFAFIVALSYGFTTLIAAFLISCLFIPLARLNVKNVVKKILLVNGLILFFWIVLPFTYKGHPLFQIGPFMAYQEGIILSAQITIKSNAILVTSIGLIATMSISTLGYTLERLHVPGKIVHLLLFTYRYIFVIEQEYQRLITAVKIRNFRPKTNMHTYKTYAYLIGILFLRASDRAERVYQAMQCRGFKGKFYCLKEFSLSLLDWAWITVMTVAIVGLSYLEWI